VVGSNPETPHDGCGTARGKGKVNNKGTLEASRGESMVKLTKSREKTNLTIEGMVQKNGRGVNPGRTVR